MKLSEHIEALQEKWRDSLNRCIGYPLCDGDLEATEHDSACPESKRVRMSITTRQCLEELDSLLVCAKEQEDELAEEQQTVTNFADSLAATREEFSDFKEQHSDDLREIAEMAIASYKKALVYGCNFPNGEKILREFREQKAKVNHD